MTPTLATEVGLLGGGGGRDPRPPPHHPLSRAFPSGFSAWLSRGLKRGQIFPGETLPPSPSLRPGPSCWPQRPLSSLAQQTGRSVPKGAPNLAPAGPSLQLQAGPQQPPSHALRSHIG